LGEFPQDPGRPRQTARVVRLNIKLILIFHVLTSAARRRPLFLFLIPRTARRAGAA